MAQQHNQRLSKRFADYRRNSKTRNLAFNLTIEQFDALTDRPCAFCGSEDHVGVDRIDSSIGYIMTNVQSCCSICNRLKSNLGEEIFLRQIARIVKYRGL